MLVDAQNNGRRILVEVGIEGELFAVDTFFDDEGGRVQDFGRIRR